MTVLNVTFVVLFYLLYILASRCIFTLMFLSIC